MRVMVALALPALASGATCSQAVCCTGITGMCKGNADAATDVTCTDANTINVGGVGTSLTVCCKDVCLAAVCAAPHLSTKADFATIAGTTVAECCDAVVTGKCSGNTDENAVAKVADDYTCTAGVLIAASATTTGETDAACCEVRCLASVCGGTGFTNTKVGFEAIVGATEAACCDADVTGKCSDRKSVV